MKLLLIPAVNLMEKLRFPYKFGLIFAVIMLPLIILSFLLISSTNDKVELLENESRGLEYIKVIRLPIEYTQQHRGMTVAYHNGNKELHEQIIEKRQTVDKYMTELDAVDKRHGADFKTDSLIKGIKSKWGSIKNNAFDQTVDVTLTEHNQLVGSLMDLMKHIADHSQISLDPFIDSYYLGISLTSRIPVLTEKMGQARALSSGIAAAGRFTPKLFTNLSALDSKTGVASEDLDKALKAAAEFNPKVTKHLNEHIESNKIAVKRMKTMINDDFLNADTIKVGSDTTFEIGTNAINEAYALFDAIVPELDALFEQRIASETTIKYVTITAVIIVLSLIMYLFTALYLSINKSISSVGSSIQLSRSSKHCCSLQINFCYQLNAYYNNLR